MKRRRKTLLPYALQYNAAPAQRWFALTKCFGEGRLSSSRCDTFILLQERASSLPSGRASARKYMQESTAITTAYILSKPLQNKCHTGYEKNEKKWKKHNAGYGNHPGATTPPGATPPRNTTLVQHHPSATPPGATPPCNTTPQHHPGATTPPGATPPCNTTPQHHPGATTPPGATPPCNTTLVQHPNTVKLVHHIVTDPCSLWQG